jgi:hypothetical protein
VPHFTDLTSFGVLRKITPDDLVSLFCELPLLRKPAACFSWAFAKHLQKTPGRLPRVEQAADGGGTSSCRRRDTTGADVRTK